jgi:hypothetical protein
VWLAETAAVGNVDDAATFQAVTSPGSSWRQYVPLVVTTFVLLDIVLGSPAANSVLKIVQKRVDEQDQQESSNSSLTAASSSLQQQQPQSKPRVNVDALVEQAMAKAENAQSLRAYLDSRKTDQDRMREIRRQQDQQLMKLNQKQQQQQQQE